MGSVVRYASGRLSRTLTLWLREYLKKRSKNFKAALNHAGIAAQMCHGSWLRSIDDAANNDDHDDDNTTSSNQMQNQWCATWVTELLSRTVCNCRTACTRDSQGVRGRETAGLRGTHTCRFRRPAPVIAITFTTPVTRILQASAALCLIVLVFVDCSKSGSMLNQASSARRANTASI